MQRPLSQNMCVNLLVVLSSKVPAGWVEGFSRLHCLLQGVDGLCEQGLLSHRIPTLKDQAEGVYQLNWYGTHFLFLQRRLGVRKLSNVLFSQCQPAELILESQPCLLSGYTGYCQPFPSLINNNYPQGLCSEVMLSGQGTSFKRSKLSQFPVLSVLSTNNI